MKIEKRIDDYFDEILYDLSFDPIIKAYILNVFSKFSLTHDLSSESVTLLYFDALQTHDFLKFQKIGDWSLWILSLKKKQNADIISNFGKLSYTTCHHMMNNSISLYYDLSVNHDLIVKELQKRLLISTL